MVTWIRGIRASTLLDKELTFSNFRQDFDGSRGSFVGVGGEALRYTKASTEAEDILGFQYDLPDMDGRIWRSEFIICRTNQDAFLTVKVNCLTAHDLATVATPRRPVFLKNVISDGLGASDGSLLVSDSPHYISEEELDKAAKIVLGSYSLLLPVIYVSAQNNDSISVNADELARDLSGLAHVVIEPTRAFSFSLREVVEGRNPYEGVLGVILPQFGMTRRIFPFNKSSSAVSDAISSDLTTLFSSRVPRFGYDWAGLHEKLSNQVRRKLVEKTKGFNEESEGLNEWVEAFQSESDAKDERIRELISNVNALTAKLSASVRESQLDDVFQRWREKSGEAYPGELMDRLSNAVRSASNNKYPLDGRDVSSLSNLSDLLEFSKFHGDLLVELKDASKQEDFPRVISNIFKEKLGYSVSYEGKHIKCTPPAGIDGLGILQLPKTPSDWRAGENSLRDAKKALGLR